MEFKDKINQSVAAAVAKIMGEALHPNQQKIDVVDDEKIDGKDFAKLRKMKKEEVERIDELSIGKLIDIKHAANKVSRDARSDSDDARAEKADRVAGTASHKAEMKYRAAGLKPSGQHKLGEESHQSKTTMKHIPNASPALKKAAKDIKPGIAGIRDRFDMLDAGGVKREQVEELDEVKMADLPSTKVQGRSYGASKPQPSAFDVLQGPKDKELKSIETEKKKPVNEEDAYDKNVKPSDKPHDKDAAKKRAETAAHAARKAMTKEEVELQEKMSASADAGDYIRDFKKSDAPQFQGKSPEKRRIMGIAAYMASKKSK